MSDVAVNLETVDTADMVNELRRRSKVFFMCMQPLADDPDHQWSRSWAVDGGDRDGEGTTHDAMARVLGLIEIAKFDLLYVKPTLDDIV